MTAGLFYRAVGVAPSEYTLPKLFEELLGSDGIYSMTLHGQKNIRILFIFEEINQQEVVVLLNCFQERRTKDYVKEISEAKSRWKELTDT